MKLPVFRLPKLVLLSTCGSVLFVCFCYVASQWYYSRWDATLPAFRGLGYGKGTGGLFTIEEIRSALSEDTYIGADDPNSRSPELVENINAFEDWLFNHPFVQYDEYSPEVLERQFKAARGNKKTELGWKIIDQFDHAHDFMINLMNLYGDQRIPFEKESDAYQFITEMIQDYLHMLDTVEDPFGVEAFRTLQQDIEADKRKRENDPEWQRIQREVAEVDKTMAALQQMLKAYDNERNIKSSGSQPFAESWIMPAPSSVDSDPDAAFSESTSQTFDAKGSLSARVEVPGGGGKASYLTDNESEVNKDTKQATPLSPERFDKAQQLIDEYGTEEGLRRFREMDPEAARQFERQRRPSPVREVPDEIHNSPR